MEKSILSFVAGVFLLLSCQKDLVPDSGVLVSFSKLKNPVEQRLAFNLLTTEEQVVLVSNHIDFCLSFFSLTPSQEKVLNQAKRNLPSFFKYRLPEENQKLLLFEEQVVEHFSNMDPKTKKLIFSTMILSETDIDHWSELPTTPPYSSNCSCSTVSDYCDSGSKCFKGGCNSSDFGCGTFWIYSCGGLCFTSLINFN